VTIELITESGENVGTVPENPVLASKFAVPEAPPFTVARPALVDRIAEGVREPITLVTGPAGSGKTQLVASWVAARTTDEPVAWITLDTEDDQPSTFWTYVIEGLRRAAAAPFPAFAPLLPSSTVDRSVLSRLAAAVCEQPGPVVLVLDGVSALGDRQWAVDLEFLLRQTEQRLRVILVGRWDPPLPLYRYRLAGQLSEVRSADLAFTAAESQHLLALHDVSLSRTGLTALLEHTEGWAAGLRLCASAFQGRDDAEAMVATISGEDTTIAEYFVGEVLRVQAPEVRRFLLETSVLEQFPPELADAVTGRSDAWRMLATLTRENAFVQAIGGGTGAYRYHRLFAELLRAQLSWEEPDHVPRLHARAAIWLAGQGRIAEAAGHAVSAGDWAGAAEYVIEDYAVSRVVLDGPRGRLASLLRDLPERLGSPEAAVVQAAIGITDGRPERSVERLTYADRLLSEPGSRCSDALTLARRLIGILLSAAEPDRDAVLRAIADAETLVAAAPAGRLSRHPELPVLLLAGKATVQGRAGAVDVAAVTFAEAIAAAEPGSEMVKIHSQWHLALIEAHRGRLGRAETLARQAHELAAHSGLEPRWRPAGAELALAWVAVERYDVEAADHHLRTAHPHCGPGADELLVGSYALVKARRLQARGELRGALKALRDVTTTGLTAAAPDWLVRELALAEARMMIAGGRLREARAVIERYPEPRPAEVAVVEAMLLMAEGEPDRAHDIARTTADRTGVSVPVAVEGWLVLAMLAEGQGDVTGVREALRRALRLATPETQRRLVHQVWTRLRRVVRDDDELAVRYRALSGESPAAAAPAAVDPVLVEPLSKREFEVLQGMAAMLPTEEIAASMFVSVNTVKTHVRSILRKLAASRRNEAVRRARALRLI
jgi:LuxR family maltose regulon positive regulatory protein